MPTAGSMISNLQLFTRDTGGDWLTETRGLEFLNQAQKRFAHNILALDEIKDYTITDGLSRYGLPTNCLMPIAVMWYQTTTKRLEYKTPSQWYDIEESNPNSEGNPDYYTVLRQQLVVGPEVPSTDSDSTTASGAMTAAVTTLDLAAASGTFRSKGFVKIESEIIEYSGVATTTLTGATRGVHGTTAASHASGTTVTQIDMQLTYRKEPTQMTASTDSPEIPEGFQSYLEKYALYLAWLAKGDMQKAQVAYNEFEKFEEETRKTVSRRSLDGLMKIQERFNRRRFIW